MVEPVVTNGCSVVVCRSAIHRRLSSAYPREIFGMAKLLEKMDILGVEWTTLRCAPGAQASGLQRARRPRSQRRRFAKEVS
jgi:hypothetical protein